MYINRAQTVVMKSASREIWSWQGQGAGKLQEAGEEGPLTTVSCPDKAVEYLMLANVARSELQRTRKNFAALWPDCPQLRWGDRGHILGKGWQRRGEPTPTICFQPPT